MRTHVLTWCSTATTSYPLADVARILSPGGSFLTQQVGHDNWQERRAFFPRQTDFGPKFDRYQKGFLAAGLAIERAETHDTPVACRSLGDLVYLLTATPWTVPGFDLEADLNTLLALEQALYKDDHIVLTNSRYIIEAHKPPR